MESNPGIKPFNERPTAKRLYSPYLEAKRSSSCRVSVLGIIGAGWAFPMSTLRDSLRDSLRYTLRYTLKDDVRNEGRTTFSLTTSRRHTHIYSHIVQLYSHYTHTHSYSLCHPPHALLFFVNVFPILPLFFLLLPYFRCPFSFIFLPSSSFFLLPFFLRFVYLKV